MGRLLESGPAVRQDRLNGHPELVTISDVSGYLNFSKCFHSGKGLKGAIWSIKGLFSPPPLVDRGRFIRAPNNATAINNKVASTTNGSPYRRQQGYLPIPALLYSPRRAGIPDKTQLDNVSTTAGTTQGGSPTTIFVANLVNDIRLKRPQHPIRSFCPKAHWFISI